MLRGALRFKFVVVILTIGVIGSTVPIGKVMGMSLIPRDDQSEYEIPITTPEGYSLDRSSRLLSELEDRIWKLKGTQHVFTTIGQTEGGRTVKGEGDVTRATIYVRMTELEERDITQFAVQQQAREMMTRLPRPASQRQRRFRVPGWQAIADISGQPRRARPEAALRIRRPVDHRAEDARRNP